MTSPGATMRRVPTFPRYVSSLKTTPASNVLPLPTTSAKRPNPRRFFKNMAAAFSWCFKMTLSSPCTAELRSMPYFEPGFFSYALMPILRESKSS